MNHLLLCLLSSAEVWWYRMSPRSNQYASPASNRLSTCSTASKEPRVCLSCGTPWRSRLQQRSERGGAGWRLRFFHQMGSISPSAPRSVHYSVSGSIRLVWCTLSVTIPSLVG